jgi:molybdopterin/thiamine biosynthesis adenylyltransferase
VSQPGRRVTVAFEGAAWQQLRSALGLSDESAFVLLARPLIDSDPDLPTTLLVRRIVPVPDDAYVIRRPDELKIRSHGWVPAFGEADKDDCVPVFVHTHPEHAPKPSSRDKRVDDQLARVAEVRTGRGHYASLILGGTSAEPTFTGRLRQSGGDWQDVDRLRIVDETVTVLGRWTDHAAQVSQIFDRQIQAFGKDGQDALGRLRIGIVGAGGTGSAVAEQLIRIGVGELVVVDHQNLADTNVTRVYGSGLADAGKSKLSLVQRQGDRIGLGTVIRGRQARITDRAAAEMLSHCDVVFGCTDDNAGRALLTRFPQFLLQLLIDCGVMIDSREGSINEIFGRLSIVTPTSPCLVCMGEINQDRAQAEMLAPDEYRRSAAEGYVPDLDTNDPAVVTFTTATAAAAVSELLARLFGYGGAEPQNRILHRLADRSISRSRRVRVGQHSCGKSELRAAGAQEPFLNWGWADA